MILLNPKTQGHFSDTNAFIKKILGQIMYDLVKSFIAYKLINHQTRIDLLAIFIDIDTYYWGLQSGMVQFLLVLEFIPIQLQGGAGKNETSLFFSILWQIFDTISQCTSSMCSGRNEKCNEKMQFRNCHYAAFASALREKTNV